MDRHIKYSRSIKGLIGRIYWNQCKNSKPRNHPIPNYTKEELFLWITSQYHFELLYDNWVTSDYDKWSKPSCDRIDDYKPYTLDNIRLTMWQSNLERLGTDMINGINNKQSKAVVGENIKTGEKVEFYSLAQAARELGTYQSNIHHVLSGKRKMAKNHKWSYKTK